MSNEEPKQWMIDAAIDIMKYSRTAAYPGYYDVARIIRDHEAAQHSVQSDGDLETVGTLLCCECQSPRNVADYILEKCSQCGDKERVIQWLA